MYPEHTPRSTLPGGVGLEVFEVTPGVTFAAHRNVAIAVWRATPTVAALRRFDDHIGRLTKKYPTFAAVIVAEAIAFQPPDQRAREEHARLSNKYEATCLGGAMVIDGRSAKHSVFRFVLTTIQLMSSPRVPQRIFHSLESAAAWIEEIVSGVEAAGLVAAIEKTRGA